MARSPDRIGDVIADRYELVDVVGRGGQGVVYKALDRWAGRDVAVKVLSSKAARDPQMQQRLLREQQALFALKGTAAVELFDVIRDTEGELCLVMELLSGVDLDEHLFQVESRRERLGLSRIAEIFDPIVDTLDLAHEAGILHRDLKPANVFLLDAGGVRLLDFGLARLKSAAPLTAAGTVMGSPSFMAPEAWSGLSDLLDHRADVYSLGVILFRCLAGVLPFSGTSLQEKFLHATKAARPSLLALRSDLPKDADEWVAQALAIDREERFANVRAMWNAFLATFEIEPPKRRTESLWASAKRTIGRLAHLGEEARAGAKAIDAPRPPPRFEMPRVPARPRPPPPLPEATIELSDSQIIEVPVPRPPPPPPPPRRPVEKTLELSDSDLEARESIPDARPQEPSMETRAAEPALDAPSLREPDPDEARRKARNKRKRERRKRRKR